MNASIRILPFIGAALLAAVCGLSCGTTDPVAGGSGTEFEGRVAHRDDTPAVGAAVYLLPADITDIATSDIYEATRFFSIIDSTTTDSNGRFSFDSIPANAAYIIEAYGDSSVAARSVRLYSAVTHTDTIIDIRTLILRQTGTLTGTIRLLEGDDPRSVAIVANGGDRSTTIDTAGSFTFSRVPAGDYALRLYPPDDYIIFDTTGIIIIPAQTTDIGIIRLPVKQAPTHNRLIVTCDSVKQLVALIWPSVQDRAAIAGYTIRRSEAGINIWSDVGATLQSDTTFIDSSVSQGKKYEYMILYRVGDVSRRWAGNTGTDVSVNAAVTCTDTFSMPAYSEALTDIAGLSNGQFCVVANGAVPQIHLFSSNGSLDTSFWAEKEGENTSQYARIYIDSDTTGNIYFLSASDEKTTVLYRWSTVHKKITGTFGMRANIVLSETDGIAIFDSSACIASRNGLYIIISITDSMQPPIKIIRPPATRSLTASPLNNWLYTLRTNLVIALTPQGQTVVHSNVRSGGHMAIRQNGNFFVADTSTFEIAGYNATGEFIGRFSLAAQCDAILAMDFDNRGNLLVLLVEKTTHLAVVRRYALRF